MPSWSFILFENYITWYEITFSRLHLSKQLVISTNMVLYVLSANEVAERWCFHKHLPRILSTWWEVCTPTQTHPRQTPPGQTPPPCADTRLGRQPPWSDLPRDDYCSGQYASYWNACLLHNTFNIVYYPLQNPRLSRRSRFQCWCTEAWRLNPRCHQLSQPWHWTQSLLQRDGSVPKFEDSQRHPGRRRQGCSGKSLH